MAFIIVSHAASLRMFCNRVSGSVTGCQHKACFLWLHQLVQHVLLMLCKGEEYNAASMVGLKVMLIPNLLC